MTFVAGLEVGGPFRRNGGAKLRKRNPPKGGEADRSEGPRAGRRPPGEATGGTRTKDLAAGQVRREGGRSGDLGDARARTPTHEDMNMKDTFRYPSGSKTKKIDP